MTQKWIITGALLCILIITSCGPSKKLKTAMSEAEELRTQVAQLTSTVNTLKGQLNTLTQQQQSEAAEFAKYKTACEETARKLKVTSAVLKEEYDQLQQIEDKVETALSAFESKGLDVYYKNGLVYVSMEDQLLYKSGSAVLGEDGKKALGSLAEALKDYPNLMVVVLGNTDSVQFKKGGDNWTLSTERANGVVRILRDQYKMDPARLTAAGRGKYNPIADNSTAEGRTKNRRTEIILNPNLERLWESIQR
jgi:chemotaxis protein MotB